MYKFYLVVKIFIENEHKILDIIVSIGLLLWKKYCIQ